MVKDNRMAKRTATGPALVIVESPAKARTINKYLGRRFVVKASLGHVRDLPQRDFGIDVADDFKPTYEVVRVDLPQPLVHAGFRAVIPKRALPPGRYRVGALVRWRGAVYLTYLKRAIEVGPGRSRPRTTGRRG